MEITTKQHQGSISHYSIETISIEYIQLKTMIVTFEYFISYTSDD